MRAALKALGRWFDYRWTQVLQISAVLRYARFSVFVVVAGGLTLLLTSQGREIAARAGVTEWDFLWYPVATLLLAVQAWFWSRLLLNRKFVRQSASERVRSDPPPHALVVDEEDPDTALLYQATTVVPRWLGYTACLIPLAALLWMWRVGQANEPAAYWLMTELVIVLAVFAAFVNERLQLTDRMLAREGGGERYDSARDMEILGRWVKAVSVIQVVGLTVWAWSAPNAMGHVFGTLPVLLLALSTIVPLGSWLILLTLDQRFPVVTALVLVGLLSSSWEYHLIRSRTGELPSRPSLNEAWGAWSRQAPTTPTDSQGRPIMVVVATAGGGITAAYWTAVVLAKINEADNNFPRRLFSISSVSGGSVGAAVFAQALKCRLEAPKLTQLVRGALEGDLLAPVIGSYLLNDMLYWYPPFSVVAGTRLKPADRAVVFENELNHDWHKALGEPGGPACPGLDLEDSFTQRASGADESWQPILMFNSTHQETGRLVVMSQARLDGARPFDAAVDYFALTKRDLRISTAALNSARFPYVSPAGTIEPAAQAAPLPAGHLVDGGYFNNDGAVTTLKMLEALEGQWSGATSVPHVIVIQISIDPPASDEPSEDSARGLKPAYIADQVVRAPHVANEISAPALTLVATRDGHGYSARNDLRVWAESRSREGRADYFHFRLLIPEPDPACSSAPGASAARCAPVVKPPLGWVLSKPSEDQMANGTLCLGENYREWKQLMGELGGSVAGVVPCGEDVKQVPSGLAPPAAAAAPGPTGKTP